MKAEAGGSTPLSSLKPDVKEICKMYSGVMLHMNYLCFGKMLLLNKNVLFILV